MSLLAPLGLLGLLGLALPLLIHLQRQLQCDPVDFAALRWLPAAVRPRRRLRLQQWLLLALRMALVALVAVLLAQPVGGEFNDAPRWVLTHPALAAPVSSEEDSTEYRWLAPGFPPIKQEPSADAGAISSLLRELDAALPAETEMVVRMPAVVAGFDAERLQLRRQPVFEVVAEQNSPSATARAPAHWSIRLDDPQHPSIRYLRAAISVLTPTAESERGSSLPGVVAESAALAQPVPAGSQVVWWLSDNPPLEDPAMADWLVQGGTLIWLPGAPTEVLGTPVWRSTSSQRQLLARRQGAGWLLQPDLPLTAANFAEVLDPDFPALVASWTRSRLPGLASAVTANLRPEQISAEVIVRQRPLDSALLWVLLILLALERLLAHWRGVVRE